jgi:hypothetical protein
MVCWSSGNYAAILAAFLLLISGGVVMVSRPCSADEFADTQFVRKVAPGVIEIRLRSTKVAEYRFGEDLRKPRLSPVFAPDGKPITADEPSDHLHHHGVWLGYDLVNGHDFWTEGKPGNNQRHERFLRIFDEADYPGFVARTAWEAGGTPLIYDERTFRFRALDNGDYLIDVAVTLTTDSDVVTIGRTKEAGLPAVRVADEIRVTAGGRIINSEGGVNERGTMHKRARWLDYCGKRDDGSWVGIAYVPHPDNRDYPPYWFVRDWGWFAPNHTLWGDPITVTPDKPFTVRCRLLVHLGTTEEARVDERFKDYPAEINGSE